MSFVSKKGAILIVAILILPTTPILGADTVETWDIGATDVDMYFGVDGLSRREKDYHAFGDIMLGYGITERFSAYLGTTLQSEDSFDNGSAHIYLGMFGTPVDTDHFDLDLFFDVSLSGQSLSQFQIGPALEINLDMSPERQSFGLYLRAGTPVYGRSISTPDHQDRQGSKMTSCLETTIGAYWTIFDGHQLLAEFSMGMHPDPAQDEREFDIGGLALGYNVSVCDSIELINQAYINIPQSGESLSVGVMIGFIATMPSAPRS